MMPKKRAENSGSGQVIKTGGIGNSNSNCVSTSSVNNANNRPAEQNNNNSSSTSLLELVKNYLYLCDDGGVVGGTVDPASPVRFLLPDKHLGLCGNVVVSVLKAISFAYDLITWFGYHWFQKRRPTERLASHREVKGEIISRGEGSITCRSDWAVRDIHVELEKGKINTMHKVFTHAIKKNGLKKCLGTRELLKEEDEVQSNGKVFKKYEMGEYLWKSYAEVDRLAASFSAGLTTMNLKPKDKICIFAETRAEWMIAAVGSFKNSYTIVTLYATLGEDAVVHGLNETEATVVLTSEELLPKFKSILNKTPHVLHLIYMEHPLKQSDPTGYHSRVAVHAFCDVIERGRKLNIRLEAPEPEDVAIIMYTSGSTGIPKGVLQSHKNVAAGMLGLTDGLGPVFSNDVYIGYLPLAHVLELMCESICFLQGIPIGYSSPLTLTSNSSKIKAGSKGDAVVLEPTIMVAVPFALDRIYKMVQEQVSQGGIIKQALFYFAYDYKLSWYYKGYNTPLVDAIVMKKPKMAVGGKVRIMISGGAPLTEDTHEFIRNCLCLPVVQGYGLTETCATATCSTPGDMSVGRAGPPLRCNDIRLINWDEGNYRVTDQPFPRGEICVGGDNVALGYYNLPEATSQDFFESDGRRWFRSGDIGEIQYDGVVRIIDRKKDLVKLQAGEYVSLGKVESELKTCALVENICVYGDSTKNFCVALVVPAEKQLTALAAKMGKEHLTFQEMCGDEQITNEVLKAVQAHGASCKLIRFEIPAAVTLYHELWTAENGLCTAAFKLKRKPIQERFQSDINRMYA